MCINNLYGIYENSKHRGKHEQYENLKKYDSIKKFSNISNIIILTTYLKAKIKILPIYIFVCPTVHNFK